MGDTMKLYALFLFLTIFAAACTTATQQDAVPATNNDAPPPTEVAVWMDETLVDVRNGDQFTLRDFAGKPVLLESFAVWCPTCTRQQQETSRFHEIVGDSVISISLDTDPNEDEARVRSHIQRNGFDWRYVVAPTGFTQSLIDEFGIGIVNAPSIPMILICEDSTFRKLQNGVKSPSDLQAAIDQGCAP